MSIMNPERKKKDKQKYPDLVRSPSEFEIATRSFRRKNTEEANRIIEEKRQQKKKEESGGNSPSKP